MKGLGIGVLLVFGSVFICLIRRCWTQIHRKTGELYIAKLSHDNIRQKFL